MRSSAHVRTPPLPGLPCVLQVVSGYYNVVLIDAKDVLEEGELETYGIDDIIRALMPQTEEVSEKVAKAQKYGLARGSNLFIPFGMVPLIISVGNASESKSSWYLEDYSAILIHYLTIDIDASVDQYIKNEVYCTVSATFGRRMKAMRGGHDKLVRWLDRNKPLEKAKVACTIMDIFSLQYLILKNKKG